MIVIIIVIWKYIKTQREKDKLKENTGERVNVHIDADIEMHESGDDARNEGERVQAHSIDGEARGMGETQDLFAELDNDDDIVNAINKTHAEIVDETKRNGLSTDADIIVSVNQTKLPVTKDDPAGSNGDFVIESDDETPQ